MWNWQGVDTFDIIGPLYMPIRMLWMIWNIAEEEKKKQNRVILQMAGIPVFGKAEEEEYWKAKLGEVKA